jgi:hypothetical protein
MRGGGMKISTAFLGIFAFSSIPLAGFSQDMSDQPPVRVQNGEAAIAIATKLCADQIEDTPVHRFAQKDGDQWIVTSQRSDQKIAVPDWWTVTIPASGSISDVHCIGRRGVAF